MNNEFLERAREIIPSNKELIILASKRAAELATGKSRPTIKVDHSIDNFLDIALLEIAEGNIKAEYLQPGTNDIVQELAALRDAKLASETASKQGIDENAEFKGL